MSLPAIFTEKDSKKLLHLSKSEKIINNFPLLKLDLAIKNKNDWKARQNIILHCNIIEVELLRELLK